MSKYFIPRDPKTAAQMAQREAFMEFVMSGLTKEEADLLYAAIVHEHGFILPFGVFQHISPMSVNPSFPYAATIAREMTLVKWTQHLYVVAPNDGSNYWDISLRDIVTVSRYCTLLSSSVSAATQSVLSTESFNNNPMEPSGLLVYVYCEKVGSPGALYLGGPILDVE